MNTQSVVSPNNIYVLKEGISYEQLASSIHRCLCQAEALAIIATFQDVETVGVDIINSYFWTLSDLVQEVKWLYERLLHYS